MTFFQAAHAAGWLLCGWVVFTAAVALVTLVCALCVRSGAVACPPVIDVLRIAWRGWLLEVLSLAAPLYMLVLVWFARLDDEPSEGAWPVPGSLVSRPRLPDWAHWADTPDERGFGLYEPTVMRVYTLLGWRACLYYWLGLRNRLHGLAWAWGQPAAQELDFNKPAVNHWRASEQAWMFEQVLGKARLLMGHKVYVNRFNYGPGSAYWAVPTVTIKRKLA